MEMDEKLFERKLKSEKGEKEREYMRERGI